ncbi:hypothetical protein AB0N66_42335, partial [Streptomyces sp. NPDC093544]
RAERILEASEVNWTLVYPVLLTTGPLLRLFRSVPVCSGLFTEVAEYLCPTQMFTTDGAQIHHRGGLYSARQG